MTITTTPDFDLTQNAQHLLALNTGHLTSATGMALDDNDWGLVIYPTDTGAIVCCNPSLDFPEHLPGELLNILERAKAAGFAWIKFDRDACIRESLPFFDW